MRALLVVNPNATTTTERGRDILVRALRSQVRLEVAYTKRRGHAAELARAAAQDGIDLVVTLGGDGTVNEAVNGLMTADTGPAGNRATERPALAVVPGGSTNVFARALGLPGEWAEGTSLILEALVEGRTRTVGLGRVDERYFTFCAGFGIDAEVVRRVEQSRRRGAVSRPTLYMRHILTQYVKDVVRPKRGTPSITIDVLALKVLHLPSSARTIKQVLSADPNPHGKQVIRLHDLASFTLRPATPTALQVDGDYLGECDALEFASVPNALRVVC
jgi:diacylglycerol kinase family enzyme